MREFHGPEVCRLAGVTYRQLDYWARTDLIRPSIKDARGSGSSRIYSELDVMKIAVMRRLVVAGVQLHAARHACHTLDSGKLDGAVLVIADGTAALCRKADELMSIARRGHVLSLVSLDQILLDLADAIEAAPQRPQLVS